MDFTTLLEIAVILIGAVLLRLLLQIAQSLYFHFKPLPNMQKIYGQKSWAVITGATDGIGYGFCEQLAAQGFNICLVSRNEDKLLKKMNELKSRINKDVEYKTIVADFVGAFNPDFFDKIKKELQNLDISILINNVGISEIQYLVNQSEQSIYNIINVNCFPMAILTKFIAQIMIKRQNYRSGIVNISSYSCIIPMPYMTVYAATKAFNDVFSVSNAREFEELGAKIDVLSVRAMKVVSGAVKQPKSLTVPTSRECAHGCLKYLGKTKITSGHLKHQLLTHLTDCIPERLRVYIGVNESRKVYEEYNVQKKRK